MSSTTLDTTNPKPPLIESTPEGGRIIQTSSSVQVKHETVHKPFGIFKPTHVSFKNPHTGEDNAVWNSREHRKGRYPLRDVKVHAPSTVDLEKSEESQVHLLRVNHNHLSVKPHFVMDVSFWVAFIFTIGSVIWVINAFLVWFPLLSPWNHTLSASQEDVWAKTAAALAFVGGTLFEVGSYLMVVESLNRGTETTFGDEVEGWLDQNKRKELEKVSRAKRFMWWGPPRWRELGYLASVIQLFAASIFWVATITGLPNVIKNLFTDPSIAIADVFYWIPQVIGGLGFIVSSGLLMIEVQKAWYIPNFTSLGWHIGLWNLIGGIGFCLCGCLGMPALHNSGALYQSSLATFWGSWAFLIGSAIQCGETFLREVPDDNPGMNSDGSVPAFEEKSHSENLSKVNLATA